MRIDKNKAVLKFLNDCPVIKDNPLFFNFGDVEDGSSQYTTSSNDEALNTTFIDGSKKKLFTFNIMTFKTISSNAIIKDDSILNENVEDLAELQEIIEWVNEQGEDNVFPNFGEGCQIESMATTTDIPYYEGVETSVSPALAMYSIAIRIEYIDYTKTLY